MIQQAISLPPDATPMEDDAWSTLAGDDTRDPGPKATDTVDGPGSLDEPPSRFVDGASFILDAPKDVPAIWGTSEDVLWAEGEALMVVGPQGVGKSTIIQQIVRARLGIGDGHVLGYPIEPGNRRVLYLACDRPSQISRSMARMFTPEDRPILTQALEVWKGPPPYDFAKYPGYLARMCETAEADTVVVDSLKDVAIGLATDEIGAAYNRARGYALAAGVQVIEAHHQVKKGTNGKAPDSLADVYGSNWITAGAGSVALIWGQAGDPVVQFKHLKQPAEPVGPLQIRHDHEHGTSTVWHATDLVLLARSTLRGLTARQAATALYGTNKPTPADIEKARRRLDRLTRGETPALTKLASDDPNTSDTYRPADQLPIEATT